jgi:hypothetical protein
MRSILLLSSSVSLVNNLPAPRFININGIFYEVLLALLIEFRLVKFVWHMEYYS